MGVTINCNKHLNAKNDKEKDKHGALPRYWAIDPAKLHKPISLHMGYDLAILAVRVVTYVLVDKKIVSR